MRTVAADHAFSTPWSALPGGWQAFFITFAVVGLIITIYCLGYEAGKGERAPLPPDEQDRLPGGRRVRNASYWTDQANEQDEESE